MGENLSDTVRLASELSEAEMRRGLVALNAARRRAGREATRWVGLPEDLRRKMFDRVAMGFDIDENPNAGELRANGLALLAVLSTVLLGTSAALAALLSPSSWAPPLLAGTIALPVLIAIRSRRAIDLRTESNPLFLTPMQISAIRGYLIAPPDLLPRRTDLLEIRLTALAGIVVADASGGKSGCVASLSTELIATDLDVALVNIYEQAVLISRARTVLDGSSPCSGSGAHRDLNLSAAEALTVLVDQVRDVCDHAGNIHKCADAQLDLVGGVCCSQEPDSLTRDLLIGVAIRELAEAAIPTRQG